MNGRWQIVSHILEQQGYFSLDKSWGWRTFDRLVDAARVESMLHFKLENDQPCAKTEIDFATGWPNPAPDQGRVFFNSGWKSSQVSKLQ